MLKSDPELTCGITKAYVASFAYAKSHPEEVIEKIKTDFSVSHDVAVKNYEDWIGTHEGDWGWSEESMAFSKELSITAGKISEEDAPPADQLYDSTCVDQL